MIAVLTVLFMFYVLINIVITLQGNKNKIKNS